MRLGTGDNRTISFDEAVGQVARGAITRRDFLRLGGALGAAFALSSCTSGNPKPAPQRPSGLTPHDARVVVVGAGLAGITAAYRLAQAGVHVQLYESRDRVGGRCWTARGFADAQTAEHGGEFIDTRHVHLRRLARELGLELDDLWEGSRRGSTWPNYIEGKLLEPKAIHEQLDPIAKKVTEEARRIGVIGNGKEPSDAAYSYGTATPAAVQLDRMTMSEWLDANVPGVLGSPIGSYLDVVMAGWYGLEMDQLSAVTWIDYFVIPSPGADERWHVRGGNDQVPNLAAERLQPGTVHLETPLEAIRKRGDGTYELRFGGISAPVVADLVILASPFTTLRSVDLADAGISAQRMGAIRELAMGFNVKLLLQYDRRPGTFHNWSGGMEHSNPIFETWESSAGQPGASGLITVYGGGRTGATWTADQPHGSGPEPLVAQTVGQIDDVVPGTAAHYNGKAWLDLWTNDPWTLGSFAAFGPGQYTKFWRNTGSAEGTVYFAGEHTSTYSQGYLNGGVESGDRTAVEVMRALGIPVPKSLSALPYSKFGSDRR